MKKIEKILLAMVIMFAFSIVAYAEATDFDFSLTDVAYDEENVEELVLLQGDSAEEYNNSLGLCKTLSYETVVEEGTDKLDTITVETSRERDEVVEEKEEEGYTTTVTSKEHDAAVLNYEFEVENDVINTATINGNENSAYEGKSANDTMNSTEFTDYEDDDVVVTNEITNNIENVSDSETVTTRSAANNLANQLRGRGYTANVTQNNYMPTVVTIRANRQLSFQALRSRIVEQATNDNPNKEIINVMPIAFPREIVETTEVDSLEEANALADELRATGEYASVNVVTEIDYDNATLVSEGNEGGWDDTEEEDYDENIYTDNIVTGYRHHYMVSSTSTTTETVELETFNGRNAERDCNNAKNRYANQGYTNLQCTATAPGPVGPGPVGPGGPANRYVLTGDITRETTTNTPYYDEYKYAELFSVLASYYQYNGTYVATDYTVNYRGTAGNVTIKKTSADKYFEIDAERPEYTVTTTGTVEEDTACLNSKTVNTGVEEGIPYELIALLASLGLITLVSRKLRKAN